MFRNLRNLAMSGLVLGLLAFPAFSAVVIPTTTYNFDSSDPAWKNGVNSVITPTTLTGNANSHLGAGGTEGILGPFGNSTSGIVQNNQIVSLTLTSPGPAFNAVTLEFDLWIFNSWDGNGQTFGGVPFTPDYFQVALGTTAPTGSTCTGSAFCATFGEASATQTWPTAGSPGRSGNLASRPASESPYFSTPGFNTSLYTFSGYDVYRINLGTINLGQDVTSITIYFRGLFSGTPQAGNDESWALGRAAVSAIGPDVSGIPEPSTIVLGGLGLALLGLAKMRSRKA